MRNGEASSSRRSEKVKGWVRILPMRPPIAIERGEIRRQRDTCVQMSTGYESAPIAAQAMPMRTLHANVEFRVNAFGVDDLP